MRSNDPSFKIAFFIGGAEENWVKERFSKAELRGATASSAPAPIEEIMAKRADAAPINRIQWVMLNKKVPGLTVLPKENNCQDLKRRQRPSALPSTRVRTSTSTGCAPSKPRCKISYVRTKSASSALCT